jgi:hypothetical protein
MTKGVKIMNSKMIFSIAFMGFFFLSCSSKKEYKEYRVADLSKPISDTLTFAKEGTIVGVEISITGNINGKATLEFENGAGRFKKIDLTNTVNQLYETEWYEPKLFFRYIPDGNVNGDSLIIKYRMY